jgi:hypothetical protein
LATFRSESAFASHLLKEGAEIKRSLEHRFDKFVKVMEQEAIELTSGTQGAAVAKLHPFSRKRPRPFPKLPINKRTGKLQRSIRVFRFRRRDGVVVRLQFTAAHSRFVLSPHGTKHMRPRDFWREMSRRARMTQSWGTGGGMKTK